MTTSNLKDERAAFEIWQSQRRHEDLPDDGWAVWCYLRGMFTRATQASEVEQAQSAGGSASFLLNPGDTIMETDEYLNADPKEWRAVGSDFFVNSPYIAGMVPVRRTRRAAPTAEQDKRDAWQTGVPPVPKGKAEELILAVRRAHSNDRVFVFAATYANQFDDDGCLSGRDGEDFVANGWYLTGLDTSGEFNEVYEDIVLSEGDEILGWQPLPKWTDLAALDATAQSEGES